MVSLTIAGISAHPVRYCVSATGFEHDEFAVGIQLPERGRPYHKDRDPGGLQQLLSGEEIHQANP